MEEKEYAYIWNDHLLLRESKIASYIEKSILEHDWKTFKMFKDLLDKGRKYPFFPDIIYIDGDWDNPIPLTEENFMKINFTEYECG